jgi:hypothetical protein
MIPLVQYPEYPSTMSNYPLTFKMQYVNILHMVDECHLCFMPISCRLPRKEKTTLLLILFYTEVTTIFGAIAHFSAFLYYNTY